jgi:acyl-CoA synthetase (AMP-forming)/AMP-acid ligase II
MVSSDNAVNIYQTLVDSATRWPNHVAVFDEFGSITFTQLLSETEELKKQLSSCGLSSGTSLAIIHKNSRYFITSLYAGIRCGCVVMPLASYQREEEITKAIAEAKIHFILSENPLPSGVTLSATLHFRGQTFYFGKTNTSFIERVDPQFPGAAVMRFTSGTTADAKCVVMSHQTIFERTQAANEGLQLTENDRVIWVLPMAFHFVVSIMLYVRYGTGIIICDDFLAENILRKAAKCEGTMLYASPMHIRLLATSKDEIELPRLKMAISTTAGISSAVCEAFEKKYQVPVSQAFGIIEVGLPIMNYKKSKENPGAVGYALPAFQVTIMDENLKTQPPSTIGMLAIQGPGMFDGYLKPFKPRAEVLKNGWFFTGDLASMNETGLIEIKGRSKNVINVSGNKVFPSEVEEVINLYDGITASKVYGRPHPLLGEMVAADVTLKSGFEMDVEKLINYCRINLSAFKVPQRINVVEKIEITASGKVKRV